MATRADGVGVQQGRKNNLCHSILKLSIAPPLGRKRPEKQIKKNNFKMSYYILSNTLKCLIIALSDLYGNDAALLGCSILMKD